MFERAEHARSSGRLYAKRAEAAHAAVGPFPHGTRRLLHAQTKRDLEGDRLPMHICTLRLESATRLLQGTLRRGRRLLLGSATRILGSLPGEQLRLCVSRHLEVSQHLPTCRLGGAQRAKHAPGMGVRARPLTSETSQQ